MTRIECITQRFEEEYSNCGLDFTLFELESVESIRYQNPDVQYFYISYIAKFCNKLLDTGYDLDENNKFVKVRK